MAQWPWRVPSHAQLSSFRRLSGFLGEIQKCQARRENRPMYRRYNIGMGPQPKQSFWEWVQSPEIVERDTGTPAARRKMSFLSKPTQMKSPALPAYSKALRSVSEKCMTYSEFSLLTSHPDLRWIMTDYVDRTPGSVSDFLVAYLVSRWQLLILVYYSSNCRLWSWREGSFASSRRGLEILFLIHNPKQFADHRFVPIMVLIIPVPPWRWVSFVSQGNEVNWARRSLDLLHSMSVLSFLFTF